MLLARLEATFEQSLRRHQYGAAVRALRTEAETRGLLRNRVEVRYQAPDEFAGRSTEELEHYAEHGYWPEDALRTMPIDTTGEELDRILGGESDAESDTMR